jgi:hypothetical protein
MDPISTLLTLAQTISYFVQLTQNVRRNARRLRDFAARLDFLLPFLNERVRQRQAIAVSDMHVVKTIQSLVDEATDFVKAADSKGRLRRLYTVSQGSTKDTIDEFNRGCL